METPYVNDEITALLALRAPVSAWLQERGYSGIGADEMAALTDPECAMDALGMLGHWHARCGLPAALIAPVVPLLAEKCFEKLGDADDADFDQMREIHRHWIGHAEADADDSGRTLHAMLCDYVGEMCNAAGCPLMTAAEFLARFPQVKTGQNTGGGCTAWEMYFPSEHYIIITDGYDACEPPMDSLKATFGMGFDCEEVDGEECVHLFWRDAVAWMEARIAKYGALPARENTHD